MAGIVPNSAATLDPRAPFSSDKAPRATSFRSVRARTTSSGRESTARRSIIRFILSAVWEIFCSASARNSGSSKFPFALCTTRESIDTKFFRSCITNAEKAWNVSISFACTRSRDSRAFRKLLAACFETVLTRS